MTTPPPTATEPTFDVLVAGMVFVDVVFTDLPTPPAPGTEVWAAGMGSSPGGIANLAVALARLGLRTGLIAGFGDDGYGEWCRQVLTGQEGIDTSMSPSFDNWHTPVTVSMAYAGDRAMVTHGHDAPLCTSRLLRADATARAVIAELDGDPWWQPLRAAGALVFADVGWDGTGAWDPCILDRLAGCHCFMPNHREAMAYTRTRTPEEALERLADRVPCAVVTLGAEGAIAVDGTTGEWARVPALPVRAIDPTGAGDCFGAALVAGTLAGWPLDVRLKFAALTAGLAVQQFGGALAAPGWGDVADWWALQRRLAAEGDPEARQHLDDYGFLPQVLPAGEPARVRRADATIAKFAHLPGPR
ncbi:PfkB family carbohydrate kinase [Micropruina sp.]|uniref:PfkB family carbohydrate kinase n=1 Tax=Micropruina sp. TaxID=2737536 RepID=UPI0039E61612